MSTDDQSAGASTTPPLSPRGVARRRLTKAGLGAASVLLTLDSRADMKPMVCVSASGAMSGGLSSNYSKPTACEGKSPGYWKNHKSVWPVSPDKRFSEVFPCNEANAATYGSKTLHEIVSVCDFDKYNFGVHLVATYLNVLSGKIGFLNERSLVDLWSQVQSKGYYEPADNVFWSTEQTKRYLEATHD